MEITENDQIRINPEQVTFSDYLNLCDLIKQGKISQSVEDPFRFSDNDIDFMISVSKRNNENLNTKCERYFELLKDAILTGKSIINMNNKCDARIAHKMIWFLQKKLVLADKDNKGILFNSQDFANFGFDLFKLSDYYVKNKSLKVEKDVFVSRHKQGWLSSNPSLHYCDIISKKGDFYEFKLLAPLPIRYELV